MILLSVGTEAFSFHRLVQAVDAAASELDEPVFGQIGASEYEPLHFEHARLVPFDRMRELLETSSRVICHAGAGTCLLAISLGHVPVVLPRLAHFGEHVDDHQVEFAHRLDERGLVTRARDAIEAVELLRRAPSRRTEPLDPGLDVRGRELSEHLLRSVGGRMLTRRAA
ncbi:glycosyltransferase [Rohdeia mirabilis]|uniref:glycosyltransferase n=1 Tax=Rohdeia mirabilis TaxID=2528008 RepID=UPI003AF34B87